MTNIPIHYELFMSIRRDVDALMKDLGALRKFVTEFNDNYKSVVDDTTGHIRRIDDTLQTFRDAVEPLEQKLFPGVTEARLKLGRIVDENSRAAKRDGEPTA